jgi:hypothetical protein
MSRSARHSMQGVAVGLVHDQVPLFGLVWPLHSFHRLKQFRGKGMVMPWYQQAVDDRRENGFLEFSGEVQVFLIAQVSLFLDDGGERLKRVACEAEAIFVDYLY